MRSTKTLVLLGFWIVLSAPLVAWAAEVKPLPTPDLSSYPKDSEGRAYIDGQVLVHFQNSVQKETRESFIKTLGFEYIKSRYLDGFLLKVPNGTVLEKVDELKKEPHFRKVTPNYLAYPASYTPYPFPNDPNYQNGNDEWSVNAIHMDQAWNSTDPWIANASLGRPSAVIAVLDSGILTTHEDFAGKISSNSWDFYGNDSDVTDTFFHGTAVAGIAAADVNNGVGGTGVCANCSLLVEKVTLPDGDATDFYLEEGIQYALQNSAKGINISFGGAPAGTFDYYSSLAFQQGSIIVGAMGNDGANIQYSPAGDQDAIGAGGIDSTGTRCSFSNYGSWIGLVAPDCNPPLFTTDYSCDTCYEFVQGTSGAAPQVSAMAAILLDLGLSPAAVTQCLYTTATQTGAPGFNQMTGWGCMNCYQALAAIRPASNLGATGGVNQVSLNWVAPQTTAFSTADYIVSRSTSSGGPYSLVGQTPNGSTLTFNDTSPNPNITYYYVVQAVDAKGNTTVVSNQVSAIATGATFTPTATITATVTNTPTPNYGDMSGFTYEGLWHLVNDLTSPCPNSDPPPWSAYYGIDSQCNFQSGNTQPSTLIMPQSLVTGSGDLNFWLWQDDQIPNNIILTVETIPAGCGETVPLGTLPQKTWVPISVICGLTNYIFIAQAANATGNTGRGIYIDAVGIGTPIPTWTPTPTGTLPPSPTPTPTFNEFVGTPSPSYTPTSTNTPCGFPGNTCTFTFTPTNTSTSTNSFTPSPTSTPSATASPTNTYSPTPTPPATALSDTHYPYPNPAAGSQVTFYYVLNTSVPQVTFKLYTTAFRRVAEFYGTTQQGANNFVYNLSWLSNGLYYYTMEDNYMGKTERKIGKLLITR